MLSFIDFLTFVLFTFSIWSLLSCGILNFALVFFYFLKFCPFQHFLNFDLTIFCLLYFVLSYANLFFIFFFTNSILYCLFLSIFYFFLGYFWTLLFSSFTLLTFLSLSLFLAIAPSGSKKWKQGNSIQAPSCWPAHKMHAAL